MRERPHTYHPVEYMGWKIVVKRDDRASYFYYLTRPNGGSGAWVEGNYIALGSYDTAMRMARFDIYERVNWHNSRESA